MKNSKSPELFYQLHVFCCVNEREIGKSSCANTGAKSLQAYFKKRCLALNLDKDAVRINQSGCLGRCELGPVMVVYPQAIWYHYKQESDIDEIITEHLLKGKIVQRLLISN